MIVWDMRICLLGAVLAIVNFVISTERIVVPLA